jgi:hypothetical protein
MDGAEARQAEIRALARDITRCAELEAVLDGRASPCREVAGWQGLTRAARWYVPEPWAGHVGAAAILFVSSNPSAGPRGEQFNPAVTCPAGTAMRTCSPPLTARSTTRGSRGSQAAYTTVTAAAPGRCGGPVLAVDPGHCPGAAGP